MTDWYDLLQEIHKRPTLYLSRRSIFDLESFYFGYSTTRRLLNLPLTAQEKEFNEFSKWVQKEYSIEIARSWSMLILLLSVDEKDAFEKFFEIFELFITRNNIEQTK
jgi:hypothetical protein